MRQVKRDVSSWLTLISLLVSIALAAAVTIRYSAFLSGELKPYPHGVIGFFLLYTAACAIALRLAAYVRWQLILCSLAVVAAIYAAEAYLWLRQAPQIAPPADGSAESDAVPSLGAASFTEADFGTDLRPLSGISNAHVRLCYENGYWAEYDSDEHGFRNPKGLWAAPIDVLMIGDSFAQGSCVRKGMADVIRERYPKTVNLGIGGNGNLANLAALKEFGPALRPRLVLWFFYENDLDPAEYRSPILRGYLQPGFSQKLIDRQAEIDRRLRAEYTRIRNLSKGNPLRAGAASWLPTAAELSGWLHLFRLRTYLGLTGIDTVVWAEHEAVMSGVLKEASSTIAGWNGHLVFVYLPAYAERYLDTADSKDMEVAYRRVMALANRFQLDTVDTMPVFLESKSPPELYADIRRGTHYSELGYRIIAERVLAHIEASPWR